MNILIKSAFLTIAIPALTALLPATVQAEDEPACPFNENRSGICGNYHSEVSPAEAFLNTVVKRGKWGNRGQWHQRGKHSNQPVIIDVRSTSEYKAGHPQYAYNVPSPYIYQYCNPQDDGVDRRPDGACISGGERIDQTEADFVNYVESILPNKDTPIYTLCRTGVRSVGAAEFLTNAGYTNVRNIWEGFVGIYLQAPFQTGEGNTEPGPVDLNHDGELTDEDKNGWRYHQGLPYETRLKRKLIYRPRADTYDWD